MVSLSMRLLSALLACVGLAHAGSGSINGSTTCGKLCQTLSVTGASWELTQHADADVNTNVEGDANTDSDADSELFEAGNAVGARNASTGKEWL